MASIRQNKVARLLQKELSDIFQREGRNLFPGKMVTITVVRVTQDLSIARVYLSIFPGENNEKVIADISLQGKHIRHELGNRVRHQLRIVPELQFYIDDSLDYVENIDELLKS